LSTTVSPYKSDFISYASLMPPVFLNTANQQQFLAIGCSTLAIQVPNRDKEIKLTLYGALHAPGISYTLISLATLDEEGYHAHIGASYLDLTSLQRERVKHITWTSECLYKVVHALNSANAIKPVLVIELHRHLGHIVAASAQKLIESGAVIGAELDLSSLETNCNACIFAHATHPPIPKV
jgi:Pol polyprotein